MPAGLVVDEKITSPYVPLGDFYLQSHGGLKGSECHLFIFILTFNYVVSSESAWSLHHSSE